MFLSYRYMYLENHVEKFVCNVYIHVAEKYKVIGKEMGSFREPVPRYK